MKGVVMRSTGSFYDVIGENGVKYNCRVRGKIRLEGIKESNPVAVGDHVLIDLTHDIGSITEILPRRNHILRQSVKKSGHSHVLAANIDQRSEERRVGKGVDLGGRRIIKRKKGKKERGAELNAIGRVR